MESPNNVSSITSQNNVSTGTTSFSFVNFTTVYNYSWEHTTVKPHNETLIGTVFGILHNLPIPFWSVVIIAIVALVLLCVICICICKCCCCRKKTAKSSRKDVVDMGKSKFPGSTYNDKVQPDLEHLTSNMEDGDPTESVYSEARPGKLEISLDFDFQKNELNVGVLQGMDLPAADMDGKSDPYVKVFFDSNKKVKFETKVHKETLNPVFNEQFIFKIPYNELIQDTLIFNVFDFNRIMKHTLLGVVKITMKNIDLNRVYTNFHDLINPEVDSDHDEGQLGDICFSLRYVPTSGKLTIVILEAKNLRKMDAIGSSDPYVKIAMYMGSKLIKKKKVPTATLR